MNNFDLIPMPETRPQLQLYRSKLNQFRENPADRLSAQKGNQS